MGLIKSDTLFSEIEQQGSNYILQPTMLVVST